MTDDSDASEPFVLLIGTLDSDGVRAKVEAAGKRYKVKRIDSSPKNWSSICDLLESDLVSSVAMKLTGNTYHALVRAEYTEVAERLLSCMARVPHALYAYEDLLSGSAEDPISEDQDNALFSSDSFYQLAEEDRCAVNSKLAELGFEIVPYRRNSELTVLVSSFIEDAEHGLLFRMYVPSGQLWANESDRLLALFRDYLRRVGHHEVTLNQRRAARGTVYEFFSPASSLIEKALFNQFQDFSKLLDLCMSDAPQAAELLANKNLNPREVTEILTRYSKEARRLVVDLRQERELKVLSIRHRLESELVDSGGDEETIRGLVEAVVPNLLDIGSALAIRPRPLLAESTRVGSLTVNVQPYIVNAVNSIVADQIFGDVHLSTEDHQLLSLIQEHAPPEHRAELGAAVRELADDSVPKETRLLSKQRIKAFLYKVAAKVPDVALGLLQSYLEKRFGLQ